MIIPREIREKIEQRNQLDEEIAGWFQENVDAYGCDIKNAYVKDNKKNLNNLSAYSQKLRVYKKVTELMEVLLNG